MENPICISTGFVYRLVNDRNKMISKIKEFSPQGIELSFAYPQYLFDFLISLENLDYLKTLEFVSIHSPWKEITYGNNQKSGDVLKAIEKLYQQIGAKNVVFHIEQVEDIQVLTNYDFTASIENGDWREEAGNSVEKIENILKANQKLKFTFDFAHAITVSSDSIPLYIEKFKDELIEVHLSMLNKDLKDHWFLHKYDSPAMRNLLNYVQNTNSPLVLECVAAEEKETQLMKEEIEFLKRV